MRPKNRRAFCHSFCYSPSAFSCYNKAPPAVRPCGASAYKVGLGFLWLGAHRKHDGLRRVHQDTTERRYAAPEIPVLWEGDPHEPGPLAARPMRTSWVGSATGSGRSSTPFKMEKTAALVPMPTATLTIAATANPGFLPSPVSAKRKSPMRSPIRRLIPQGHHRQSADQGAGIAPYEPKCDYKRAE